MYIDVFLPFVKPSATTSLPDTFGEVPEVGSLLTQNNPNTSTNIVLLHHSMTKQLLLLHLTLGDCIL
jgi:hypothetical protein